MASAGNMASDAGMFWPPSPPASNPAAPPCTPAPVSEAALPGAVRLAGGAALPFSGPIVIIKDSGSFKRFY